LNQRDDGSNRNSRSKVSFHSINSTVSSFIHSLKKASGWKEAELPQHELRSSPNGRPNDHPAPPTEPQFLLLCHSEGIYTTKLLQLSVCDLKSDKALFTVLRKNYRQMRNKWWSFVSFRTLKSIRFVQFEMYKSALVDIRQKDAIPPLEHVGCEYRYSPAPPETMPPVGGNLLMHYFRHPSHAEDVPVCLERFPKKLRERLAVCGGRVTGLGWGLDLEEGRNSAKSWYVAFGILVLGSVLWGILWTVFEHSIQDAFAISGYMISLAVATVGFTQAVVGNLE
jgi:hypothetical protein